MIRLCAVAALCFASFALAADKKKPKLDLGLKVDVGGSIPKGDDLVKPREKQLKTESSATPVDLSWSVVKVQHARSFTRGPNGAVASGAYEVTGSGNPFTTEKFTTVVRVKCKQKADAPIELAVVDNRGNALMEGNGRVYFRGEKSDEADFTLDWDPTAMRGPGQYSLVVKVADNVVGTYPFRVSDKNGGRGDGGS